MRRPASLPIPILGRTGGRAFEGGFDPSFTDHDGRTIRQIGKTSGDEAIELLARDFQARRNRPATAERAVNAMLDAAEKGRVDDLGRLLDSHLDLIDARDCNSARTALHMSTWRNRADCVRLLVQIRDYRDNVYALHFAPEAADLDVVRLLVEAGSDVVGDGDDHQMSVLSWATCLARVLEDVAAYLLAQGTQLNLWSAIAGPIGRLLAHFSPRSSASRRAQTCPCSGGPRRTRRQRHHGRLAAAGAT